MLFPSDIQEIIDNKDYLSNITPFYLSAIPIGTTMTNNITKEFPCSIPTGYKVFLTGICTDGITTGCLINIKRSGNLTITENPVPVSAFLPTNNLSISTGDTGVIKNNSSSLPVPIICNSGETITVTITNNSGATLSPQLSFIGFKEV